MQETIFPTKLVVLGRGLEDASSDFPGAVRPAPSQSADSYARAVRAAEYYSEHPDIPEVQFVGGHSFAMPLESVPRNSSEAAAMSVVAIDHGLPQEKARVLNWSKSTYGNWIEVARHNGAWERFGVVAHPDHMARALRIGRHVIPKAVFTEIPVHDADAAARKPNRNDLVAAALYGVYMARTKAGDLDAIQRQDEKVQRRVLQALRVARKLGSIVQDFKNKRQPQAA